MDKELRSKRLVGLILGLCFVLLLVVWLLSRARDPVVAPDPSASNTSDDFATVTLDREIVFTAPGKLPVETATPSTQNAAQSEELAAAEHAACTAELVDWLALRDTPDTLIAAAVLPWAGQMTADLAVTKRKSQALLQRAIELSPTDASIRWLAISLCEGSSGCDPTENERALRALDPKNAAGWLSEVSRKSRETEFDEALHAMAEAERLDLYWAENVERIARAMESAPAAPPQGIARCATDTHVAGAVAALPIPAFAPLTSGCKLPAATQRVAECRAIGNAMRNGDTLVVQAIGFAIGLGVVAHGSAEEQKLQQDRRRFAWQREQARRLDQRLATDWMRLQRENRSEVGLMQALLRENGVPLEPPTEWMPNTNR